MLTSRFWRATGSSRRRLAVWAIAPALALIVGMFLTPTAFAARPHSSTLVGPKTYYLALGDSLAFGYQPNLDFSHGYAQQWYSSNLSKKHVRSYTNYGCNGETSYTFINGGCPYAYLLHTYYAGSQLNAAISFIKGHAGKVSPVSLDIGANDLLPDIDSSTCTVSSNWSTDLANLDTRLTGTILPQLVAALTVNGVRTGDLVMMNYYDPYQNICPNSLTYVETLNQHLAADAAQFNVPVSDVFTAIGGDATPNPNICSDTWMCSSYHDIHATTTGYSVIANTFASTTGY
ncbi:MAG TPA: SGNH/GDSL hydrolase family protein [Ktedonobacterales bacterium]|nr:SGNH/GDSL hydrolase family protein [Ktedonobacterales bacterium]